jgi:hypothetical protein
LAEGFIVMIETERRTRNRAIIDGYSQGIRCVDLAEHHNLTARHISNIVASAGLAKPRGRPQLAGFADDAARNQYKRWQNNFGTVMAREMAGMV